MPDPGEGVRKLHREAVKSVLAHLRDFETNEVAKDYLRTKAVEHVRRGDFAIFEIFMDHLVQGARIRLMDRSCATEEVHMLRGYLLFSEDLKLRIFQDAVEAYFSPPEEEYQPDEDPHVIEAIGGEEFF